MSLDEFALIRRLTEGRQSAGFLKQRGIVTGIGDDAAVAQWKSGMQLVLTCDTMTQDIHFTPVTMSDMDIGFKAMASAVSDVAAMGGLPRYALISLTVLPGFEPARLEAVYSGLYRCAAQFETAVAGGDTTSSTGGLTLSVSVIGEVEAGRALLRSAAQPGDIVFVTGWPGMAAAGLELLLKQTVPAEEQSWVPGTSEAMLTEAHRRPLPQVGAGRLLLEHGCSALNDVSDGIASEAWEIAEASAVSLILEEASLPVSPWLKQYCDERQASPADYILFGGEDYQLLGTIPPDRLKDCREAFAQAGIPFHPIGVCAGASAGVYIIRSDGERIALEKKGYNHFRD